MTPPNSHGKKDTQIGSSKSDGKTKVPENVPVVWRDAPPPVNNPWMNRRAQSSATTTIPVNKSSENTAPKTDTKPNPKQKTAIPPWPSSPSRSGLRQTAAKAEISHVKATENFSASPGPGERTAQEAPQRSDQRGTSRQLSSVPSRPAKTSAPKSASTGHVEAGPCGKKSSDEDAIAATPDETHNPSDQMAKRQKKRKEQIWLSDKRAYVDALDGRLRSWFLQLSQKERSLIAREQRVLQREKQSWETEQQLGASTTSLDAGEMSSQQQPRIVHRQRPPESPNMPSDPVLPSSERRQPAPEFVSVDRNTDPERRATVDAELAEMIKATRDLGKRREPYAFQSRKATSIDDHVHSLSRGQHEILSEKLVPSMSSSGETTMSSTVGEDTLIPQTARDMVILGFHQSAESPDACRVHSRFIERHSGWARRKLLDYTREDLTRRLEDKRARSISVRKVERRDEEKDEEGDAGAKTMEFRANLKPEWIKACFDFVCQSRLSIDDATNRLVAEMELDPGAPYDLGPIVSCVETYNAAVLFELPDLCCQLVRLVEDTTDRMFEELLAPPTTRHEPPDLKLLSTKIDHLMTRSVYASSTGERPGAWLPMRRAMAVLYDAVMMRVGPARRSNEPWDAAQAVRAHQDMLEYLPRRWSPDRGSVSVVPTAEEMRGLLEAGGPIAGTLSNGPA